MSKSTAIYYRAPLTDKNKVESYISSVREYLKKQRVSNIKVYIDYDYSAGNLDRPAISQLISEIKNGDIEMVITKHTSRITREIRNFIWWNNLMLSNSVQFVIFSGQSNGKIEKNKMNSIQSALNLAFPDDNVESL